MKYSIDKQEQYTILTLEEEKLDSTISPELKSDMVKMQAEGVGNLILNLKNTRYADSSGLSALLTGNRTFQEANGEFVLCELQPMVEKLISISQLNKVFNILPTTHEAVENVLMTEMEKQLGQEEDSAE